MKFFDSLVHATLDGSWLGGTRYDASLDRLLREMEHCAPCRACLVAIADHVDNETVLRFARLHPDALIPIGSINPGSLPDAAAIRGAIGCLADEGFQGLKLHPRLGRYDPLDLRCLEAIDAAGENGLVVFLDTLFRQPGLPTRHPADVIDVIANRCRGTRIVLLHGGGSLLLDMFEMVRMHDHLVLDASFTMLRYAGSSIDADLAFLFRTLDQRMVLGSDFPEYTPAQALARFELLAGDLPQEKRDNILFRNLERLFPTNAAAGETVDSSRAAAG